MLSENLTIRLSRQALCFARYDSGHPSAFAFSTFRLNPMYSLAANLHEAARTEPLMQAEVRGDVQVLVESPVTYVPLAEFQEEEAEQLYALCHPSETRRRVFYDIVTPANCVVLFSLEEVVCHTLEEQFPHVHYVSTLTPVLRHFAGKGAEPGRGVRIFVYQCEQALHVVAFEDTRLLVANSFETESAADTVFYTLSVAQQLGAPLVPTETDSLGISAESKTCADDFTPLYVAADDAVRNELCEALREYAVNVRPVSSSAEYNRHKVATTKGVPYDVVTFLLGNG